MKIKIVSSDDDNSWYKNKINEIVDVILAIDNVNKEEKYIKIISPCWYDNFYWSSLYDGYILKSDTVIIN